MYVWKVDHNVAYIFMRGTFQLHDLIMYKQLNEVVAK